MIDGVGDGEVWLPWQREVDVEGKMERLGDRGIGS